MQAQYDVQKHMTPPICIIVCNPHLWPPFCLQKLRFPFFLLSNTQLPFRSLQSSTSMASNDPEHKEEETVAAEDEDTGAQVAPIVKLEEVAVTTGEEDEDAILDL